MNIGIKLCGGCNPKYDRKNFFKKLCEKINRIHNVEYINEDCVYDYVIVICGCESCCASHENLKVRRSKIFVVNENDYLKIINIFKQFEE